MYSSVDTMRRLHTLNWGELYGWTSLKNGKNEKIMITHYKKAPAIFNLVGMKDSRTNVCRNFCFQ
jgi:hypothetical protein